MCKVFKIFLIDIIMRVQSWSIKKQMMLCYLLGIFIIVTMVIGVVVLNTFLLQQQTVDKVEETRNSQADQDLHDLALTGSQVLYSRIYGGTLSLEFIQNMLIDMFHEITFPLNYTDLYEFKDLGTDEITVQVENYGNTSISFASPTIYKLKVLDDDASLLSNKISRFSFVLPTLLKLFENNALRYTLYFEEAGFVYFYPGINVTDYDPSSTIWYKSFKETLDVTYTQSYSDILGNTENDIVSVVVPLYDSETRNNIIGALCGDWLVESLYYILANLKYLGKGNRYIVYKDGSLVDPQRNPWINPKYTNLTSISDTDFWAEIVKNPNKINYLIESDDIWRVATSAVTQNPDTDKEWEYILMILVKESDVMLYKESAKNKIKDEGVKFIIITIVCSVIASSVIICFIHFQSKSISKPIQGIIDFTYKLNTEGNNSEVLREIDDLDEGTDQIERLVLAYKSLAKSLINRKNSLSVNVEDKSRLFPPNELRRIDRSLFDQNLDYILHSNKLL